MLTLSEFAYNLVMAKVVHAAYLPYKKDIKTSDLHMLYTYASENYSKWYKEGLKGLGLSRFEMAPMIKEGVKVFNSVRANNPSKSLDDILSPAMLKQYIDVKPIVDILQRSKSKVLINTFNNAIRGLNMPEVKVEPKVILNSVEWFPVKGFEGKYECTKEGVVRTLMPSPKTRNMNNGSSKIIKGWVTKGELYFGFNIKKGGSASNTKGYTVILESIGGISKEEISKSKIQYVDGNPLNIAYANLRLVPKDSKTVKVVSPVETPVITPVSTPVSTMRAMLVSPNEVPVDVSVEVPVVVPVEVPEPAKVFNIAP